MDKINLCIKGDIDAIDDLKGKVLVIGDTFIIRQYSNYKRTRFVTYTDINEFTEFESTDNGEYHVMSIHHFYDKKSIQEDCVKKKDNTNTKSDIKIADIEICKEKKSIIQKIKDNIRKK